MNFFKNEYDMATLAAILSKCAAMRDWSLNSITNINEVKVQEVQCAIVDGYDYIFICGNRNVQHHESVHILNFLNAFGVNGEYDLLETVSMCHQIFSADINKSKQNFGVKFNCKKYTQTEQPVVCSDPYFSSRKINLNLKSMDEVNMLIKNEKKESNGKLWGVGRLIGHDNGSAFSKGILNLIKSTDNFGSQINVLEGKNGVHAELVIMAFLTELILIGHLNPKTIRLGGLKCACSDCSKWLDRFEKWLFNRFGAKLKRPEGDNRNTYSFDSGFCPEVSGAIYEKNKEDPEFELLFSGKSISTLKN